MVTVVEEFFGKFPPAYFFGQFFAEHRSPNRRGVGRVVGVGGVANSHDRPIARRVVVHDNLKHRVRRVSSVEGFRWKCPPMFESGELLMRERGAGEPNRSVSLCQRPTGAVGGDEGAGFVFPEYFSIERFFVDAPFDRRLRFGSLGELFEVRLRTVTEVRREQAGSDLNHQFSPSVFSSKRSRPIDHRAFWVAHESVHFRQAHTIFETVRFPRSEFVSGQNRQGRTGNFTTEPPVCTRRIRRGIF